MRRAFANRVDNTAKALIQHAKDLGFDYEPVNGSFDGVLFWGDTAVVVDFKSEGGTLTPKQQRMVARGLPIRYLSRPEQINALREQLMWQR